MSEIDNDASGEIDWMEYLELMVSLKNGTECNTVRNLLARPPIILIVDRNKMARARVIALFKSQIKEAELSLGEMSKELSPEFLESSSGRDAIAKYESLPPGRRIAIMLVNHELMDSMSGLQLLQDLSRRVILPPPAFLFIPKGRVPRGHKPEQIKEVLDLFSFDEKEAR